MTNTILTMRDTLALVLRYLDQQQKPDHHGTDLYELKQAIKYAIEQGEKALPYRTVYLP